MPSLLSVSFFHLEISLVDQAHNYRLQIFKSVCQSIRFSITCILTGCRVANEKELLSS